MTGKVSVIDTRDNTTKQISKCEFENNNYYVHINSQKYRIYNKIGELIYDVYGAFNKFCKNNNLPYSLATSHRNGGAPIYQIANRVPPKFKTYQGWYAIQY